MTTVITTAITMTEALKQHRSQDDMFDSILSAIADKSTQLYHSPNSRFGICARVYMIPRDIDKYLAKMVQLKLITKGKERYRSSYRAVYEITAKGLVYLAIRKKMNEIVDVSKIKPKYRV